MNEPALDQLARQLAERCRFIVEDLLFGWELAEIDRELTEVIRDELQQWESLSHADRSTSG